MMKFNKDTQAKIVLGTTKLNTHLEPGFSLVVDVEKNKGLLEASYICDFEYKLSGTGFVDINLNVYDYPEKQLEAFFRTILKGTPVDHLVVILPSGLPLEIISKNKPVSENLDYNIITYQVAHYSLQRLHSL